MTVWSKQETQRLVDNISIYHKDLANLFPDRSSISIYAKAKSLGFRLNYKNPFCSICLNKKQLYGDRLVCRSCSVRRAKKRLLNPEVLKLHCEYIKNKNAEVRASRLTNRKIRDIKRLYGLSEYEYSSLLEKSNGRCAICCEETNGLPNVDHCHTSGKIRGILCRNCNLALGFFKDNIQSLKNAITYLEE